MPKITRGKGDNPGPTVRLALGAEIIKTVGEKALRSPTAPLAIAPVSEKTGANSVEHHVTKGGLGMPTERLAYGDSPPERNGTSGLEKRSPALRLAINGQGQGEVNGALGPTVRLVGQSDGGANTSILPNAFSDLSDRPALLVSYVYLDKFLANRGRYYYRDWVLDSGAFSAHNSGVEIKLQDYIDCCHRLMQSDPTLTEIFSLDVIGNWQASLENVEEMWRQGVPAIPCFHYGEPWQLLLDLCKKYPKVALGGCVGRKDKDKFAGQCFARVWPHRLHGFGFGSEKSIMMFPWHSVDATNWEIAPCKYGQWKAFGTQRVSVRGSKQNLRAEVEWYLDLERRARDRWKGEMAKLPKVGSTGALARSGNIHTKHGGNKDLTVRLAVEPNAAGGKRIEGALAPTIRLVGNGDVVCERQIKAFSKEPKGKKK